MSIFSWLFNLSKNSRYSKHGTHSKHGYRDKHGYGSERGRRQQYVQDLDMARCRQCRSIIAQNAKFCGECGASI